MSPSKLELRIAMMSYAQPQSSNRRLMALAAVGVFHVLLVYALVNGLARKIVEVVRPPLETKNQRGGPAPAAGAAAGAASAAQAHDAPAAVYSSPRSAGAGAGAAA